MLGRIQLLFIVLMMLGAAGSESKVAPTQTVVANVSDVIEEELSDTATPRPTDTRAATATAE